MFRNAYLGNGRSEEKCVRIKHYPRHNVYFHCHCIHCIMLAIPRSVATSLSLRTFRFNHSSVPRLNSVTEHDLAHFQTILPRSSILSTYPPSSTPPEELDQFNSDWMGKYRGHSTTVLKPKTTQQVSEIVKWCNEKHIGIVPQGGNTGLVGGSVPVKDEVILSLANMATVRSFDPVSGNYHSILSDSNFTTNCAGILVADAGCILQSLTDYIAPHNHIMPIDLGAKGRYGTSGTMSIPRLESPHQLSYWGKCCHKCWRPSPFAIWIVTWHSSRPRGRSSRWHYSRSANNPAERQHRLAD